MFYRKKWFKNVLSLFAKWKQKWYNANEKSGKGLHMKIELEKKQIVLFVIIILFCILAIAFVFYWQIFEKGGSIQKNYTDEDIARIESLKLNFGNLFHNQIQANGYEIVEEMKLQKDQAIVYTSYQKNEVAEGKYELEVSIPRININKEEVQACNEKIRTIFENKAGNIMASSNLANTIYSVKYTAYIHQDILSLVVLANLKEGQNPQREIIATYNYDLIAGKFVTLEETLKRLQIEERQVQTQIQKEIAEAEKQTQELKKLGYDNLYTRDLESESYKIKNTDNFFIGNDGMLYIIYAYGNRNLTNTTDLILIPID